MKIMETENLDQETHLTMKTMEKGDIKNDTKNISKVTLKMSHIRLATTCTWNWQPTNKHNLASLYKILAVLLQKTMTVHQHFADVLNCMGHQ